MRPVIDIRPRKSGNGKGSWFGSKTAMILLLLVGWVAAATWVDPSWPTMLAKMVGGGSGAGNVASISRTATPNATETVAVASFKETLNPSIKTPAMSARVAEVKEPTPTVSAKPTPTVAPKKARVLTSHKRQVEKRNADGEFLWVNYGEDPFAKTREEALANRGKFFVAASDLLTPQLALRLDAAMRQPGTETRINKGARLDLMMSGGDVAHRPTRVAFKNPPVADGRMEYSAPAEMWEAESDGVKAIAYRPYVCNNLSLVIIESDCDEIRFNAVVHGQVRWGMGSRTGALPPSACNAQRQGDGLWTAWVGVCDDCVPPEDYLEGLLGGPVKVPHKYLYDVTARSQVLRFSHAVRNVVVYICLIDADGNESCGEYVKPQDWLRDRNYVQIYDSQWIWDIDNCPE